MYDNTPTESCTLMIIIIIKKVTTETMGPMEGTGWEVWV